MAALPAGNGLHPADTSVITSFSDSIMDIARGGGHPHPLNVLIEW
jgi:hypothetical protein